MEENKSVKSKVIKFSVLGGILILVVLWLVLSNDIYRADKTVGSQEEIYSLINTAVKKGKGEIYFESLIMPSFIDLYVIMENATADGEYSGCEIYALKYDYIGNGHGWDVHVHLSEPSGYASFMTKLRVKQIASKFEDLPDDYEKIKAVHDYLVLRNRYVAFEGGAYSALYKGRSSCSGYAFSFYAIMRELGIPVTMETGSSHAWNTVQLDGKWYNMDVTWDDDGRDTVSYDYFLKCNADFTGHHHGGSDAESSVPVRGLPASEYCGMVPNYNLIFEICLILVCLLPVVLLGIHLYKKKKKEAPIAAGKVMVAGSWSYMMPAETERGFEVIRKYGVNPAKQDIWGFEEGRYYHIREAEAENLHEKTEIPAGVFFDELDFIISVSRSSNARELCDALMNARDMLSSGNYGRSLPGGMMQPGIKTNAGL